MQKAKRTLSKLPRFPKGIKDIYASGNHVPGNVPEHENPTRIQRHPPGKRKFALHKKNILTVCYML